LRFTPLRSRPVARMSGFNVDEREGQAGSHNAASASASVGREAPVKIVRTPAIKCTAAKTQQVNTPRSSEQKSQSR